MDDLKPTQDTIQKLSFNGKNDVFDAVMAIIDNFVSIETAQAIAQDIPADKRGHQCGRVEGLVDLKVFLIDVRTQAARKNAPDVV
jgi:hypothetical protein